MIAAGNAPPQGMKNPQAHHDLPQAKDLKVEFQKRGLDINKARYGRWIDGSPTGNHQNWSYAFNKAWRDFFKTNPNATMTDVLREMLRLRRNPRFQ